MTLDGIPFLTYKGKDLLTQKNITDPDSLIAMSPLKKFVELEFVSKASNIDRPLNRARDILEEIRSHPKNVQRDIGRLERILDEIEDITYSIKNQRNDDQCILNSLRIVRQWKMDKLFLSMDTKWRDYKVLSEETIKTLLLANKFGPGDLKRPATADELYKETWDRYIQVYDMEDLSYRSARILWDSLCATLNTTLPTGGPPTGGGGQLPGGGGQLPGGGGQLP